MVHLLTPRESIPYAQDYLDRADLGADGDCLGYEDIPSRTHFPDGLYVFTGINRLGPAAVHMLAELHRQLEVGTGRSPLNHPSGTLRRYELLQALHREGMNDFRAFGAWEDLSDVRFPAFVRPREMDGGVPKLLRSEKEVEKAIGEALMGGWSLRDLIVVEFEDTADEAGRYNKYSAYVVGNRIIPTSVDSGRHWVMRSDTVDRTKEGVEEELRFVQENPHEDQLVRVFSIANTQFGRIDYSIKRGRVQTWEINTLPLLRRPIGNHPVDEEMRALREPSKALFKAAFSAAWKELLITAPHAHPIQFSLGEDLLAGYQTELDSRGVTAEPINPLFPGLRRILGPLKPILKPLAERAIHPLLGKRARRAAGQ